MLLLLLLLPVVAAKFELHLPGTKHTGYGKHQIRSKARWHAKFADHPAAEGAQATPGNSTPAAAIAAAACAHTLQHNKVLVEGDTKQHNNGRRAGAWTHGFMQQLPEQLPNTAAASINSTTSQTPLTTACSCRNQCPACTLPPQLRPP